MESNQSSSWIVPIAIIIGFGLIALAIFATGGKTVTEPQVVAAPNPAVPATTSSIPQVDGNDYIKGNPNAQILIVEYSDYDCPFCKEFHVTMNRIMDDYGVTGKVAWVYRQLPIDRLHPNASRISLNALCVGSLGGNDAFWTFSDLVFQERNLNEPTNITRLTEYAVRSGVDRAALLNCLENQAMTPKLTASIEGAIAAGIESTPTSYVIVGDQIAPISGAQPYPLVKSVIDNLLVQLEGPGTPALP